MDRGCLYGVMEVLMTGILRIIIYKGWGFIHGPMGEGIKVNGRIIKWMGGGNLGLFYVFNLIVGRMAGSM